MSDLHTVAHYRRNTVFRVHEPLVMPGIFQTETYMRQMLAFWYPFLDAPDDTDANVALKQQRTAAALHPSKRTYFHSACLHGLGEVNPHHAKSRTEWEAAAADGSAGDDPEPDLD